MKTNSEPYVVKFKKAFAQTSLLDANEQFIPNVPTNDAIRLATEFGMDLVCFKEPEDGQPAFCKILNFGKWKYWQEKSKKKEHHKETKEIRVSMNIDIGDQNRKVKQAQDILTDNDDVLFTMKLFGRDRIHVKEAVEKMDQIVGQCAPIGKEAHRNIEGNKISVRLQKA